MSNAPPTATVIRKILVVDDVELNRILTSAVLTQAAYDVDSVADGVSALRAVANKAYDLVLMDLEMPELAGHAAAAAIRRRSNGTMPKLVALSAKGGTVDRQLSVDIGMDDHITRPIAPCDLLREVDRVLQAPCVGQKVDPAPQTWNRAPYLDLANHLGHARLEGTLVQLRAHCEALLRTLTDPNPDGEAIRHQAHDLSSVAGMLGFETLSRICRDILALPTEASRHAMLPSLDASLRRAIAVLARHVASVQVDVAA